MRHEPKATQAGNRLGLFVSPVHVMQSTIDSGDICWSKTQPMRELVKLAVGGREAIPRGRTRLPAQMIGSAQRFKRVPNRDRSPDTSRKDLGGASRQAASAINEAYRNAMAGAAD